MTEYCLKNYSISKKEFLLIFLITMTYSLIVLFPNLMAQWGLVDDHVIITAMGRNHRLLLKDIPNLVANIPEISKIGHYPRVQPFYILFTIAQTYFFGSHVVLWYALRIFLFGLSLFIFTIIAFDLFDIFWGAILVSIIATHHFWGDIWARIGPAEIYATPLFAVFSLIFLRIWNKKTEHSTFYYYILAITAILLLGTKENMIFILPALIILVWRKWQKQHINKLQLIISGTSILWGFFIAGAIYSGLHQNADVDFYGTPVSISYRFNMIYHSLASYDSWNFEYPAIIPLFAGLFIYGVCQVHNIFSLLNWGENTLKILQFEIILFLLWLFQLFIYFKNNIPHGRRYDFPGVLFTDLAYIVIIYYTVCIVINCVERKKSGLLNYYKRWQKGLFLLVILLFVTARIPDAKSIYACSLQNQKKTIKFHKILSKVIADAECFPAAPIIFVSHWVWDFEPINAMRQYLSINGVENPLAIKIEDYSEKTVKGNIPKKLASKLRSFSLNGSSQSVENIAPEGTKFLSYTPFFSIDLSNKCFMIGYSGTAHLPCLDMGTIYH